MCDEHWIRREGNCYLIVLDFMNWFGAYAHCKRLRGNLYAGNSSIVSAVTGKYTWTRLVKIRKHLPVQWKWSNGTALQWTYERITVDYLGCSGCGYIQNKTLRLTSHCNQNRSFVCQDENSGIQGKNS